MRLRNHERITSLPTLFLERDSFSLWDSMEAFLVDKLYFSTATYSVRWNFEPPYGWWFSRHEEWLKFIALFEGWTFDVNRKFSSKLRKFTEHDFILWENEKIWRKASGWSFTFISINTYNIINSLQFLYKYFRYIFILTQMKIDWEKKPQKLFGFVGRNWRKNRLVNWKGEGKKVCQTIFMLCKVILFSAIIPFWHR